MKSAKAFKQLRWVLSLTLLLTGMAAQADTVQRHRELIAVSPVDRGGDDPGYFTLEGNAAVTATPRAHKVRAGHVAPPASVPAAPDIAGELPDDQAEGAAIVNGKCERCDEMKRKLTRLPVSGPKIARNDPEPIENPDMAPKTKGRVGMYENARQQCYAQHLLSAAKRNVARNYGNRLKSAGTCVVGVRTSIAAAGVYGGGSRGWGAIDWSARGILKSMGFKNRINDFPDARHTPPGAVLVFAGPLTERYLVHGERGAYGHRGNYVGHITISGDEKRGSSGQPWYYTDARTDVPAVGWPANRSMRRLVGVFVMDHCTGSCSAQLRNACEDL